MKVVTTADSARAAARGLARPLGFVPTMGALHAGHRSLLERARSENAGLAASLFVNPLQFGPGEDFERYPRSFEDDAAQFAAAGVDLLYAPTVQAMYPPGFSLSIDVGPLGASFEGAARAGHFTGVATVVAKLLVTIEPARLYLGQKDVQQTSVIRRMIRDLDLPVEVVVCPIVREPDGLALSSRNAYLDAEQRAAAPSLHRALAAVAAAFERDGDLARALTAGRPLLEAPLTWEYLSLVDPHTFDPAPALDGSALVIGAARAGRTRLIDNVVVNVPALQAAGHG
jgi:pantoate--beta-alanine ligase